MNKFEKQAFQFLLKKITEDFYFSDEAKSKLGISNFDQESEAKESLITELHSLLSIDKLTALAVNKRFQMLCPFSLVVSVKQKIVFLRFFEEGEPTEVYALAEYAKLAKEEEYLAHTHHDNNYCHLENPFPRFDLQTSKLHVAKSLEYFLPSSSIEDVIVSANFGPAFTDFWYGSWGLIDAETKANNYNGFYGLSRGVVVHGIYKINESLKVVIAMSANRQDIYISPIEEKDLTLELAIAC